MKYPMKRFFNTPLAMISTLINVQNKREGVIGMKHRTYLSISKMCGLITLVVVLLLLAPVGRAFGLSNVDTAHLGVGTLVYRLPDSELGWVCSGTLITPQVFLTAGHCTSAVESWLSAGLIQAAYVSFDAQFTQSVSLVDVAGLVTHPEFNPAYNINSDTHDLGVVLLATPVYDHPITNLPKEGVLDSLQLSPNSPVTAIGYGLDSNDVHGAPSPRFSYADTGTRTSGILSYRALTPAFIMVTQLANQQSDNICFGDSGGPDFVLVDGQEQLVAINIVINSYACEEVAWLYRLDTPQARSFLSQYMALP